MSSFARNDILTPTKSYDVGRVSVYDSFLEPIRGDQSRELEIVTNAHVHQVVFEGTHAVGVRKCAPMIARSYEHKRYQ